MDRQSTGKQARVAIIYYGGFRGRAGGAFSHVSGLERGLSARGWNVRVIALDDLPWWCRYVPHFVERLLNTADAPMGFWAKGRVTRRFYRWFFDDEADLRVFEDIYLSWATPTPSVTLLHAVWSDNLQAFSLSASRVAKLRAKEATCIDAIPHEVLTVSSPYAEYLRHDHFQGRLAKPLRVVELGMDQGAFHAPASRRPRSLVTVGSLEPRKNLTFLIDVFKIVHDHDPTFTLTIVGDGPDRKELETHAKGLGLPVAFTGRLPRDGVIRELLAHETYVHTSTKESFSFALLEAKLAGLRTCAYARLQVPQEFIDQGIDGFDPLDWARGILTVDKKGGGFTPERFTIERMTSETLRWAGADNV